MGAPTITLDDSVAVWLEPSCCVATALRPCRLLLVATCLRFFAAMSCSKGSKSGGSWQTWPSKGAKGSKGQGRGSGKAGPDPDQPHPSMAADKTYRKYLEAGDPFGALIYQWRILWARRGPSIVYISPLPPRAAGGTEGARSDRPGAGSIASGTHNVHRCPERERNI